MEVSDYENYDDEWWIVYKSYMMIAFVAQILLSFTIIKVKSSRDILQGVNKLDHLLKVSVFQVYKNYDLEVDKKDLDSIFD